MQADGHVAQGGLYLSALRRSIKIALAPPPTPQLNAVPTVPDPGQLLFQAPDICIMAIVP
jgi:hypothetical protein